MIHFYWGSGSPFAWRVHLCLEEKGLPYESHVLSFSKAEHRDAAHLARHPHGKVPALVDGDLTLYESSAIVEYLDERYPSPPLVPDDPAARAGVRIEELECLNDAGPAILGLARLMFFTPEAQREASAVAAGADAVRAEIAGLETRAKRRAGAFVLGASLTRADLCWLPFLELAGRARVVLEPVATPWLVAWRDRLRARPSYDRTYPPHWRA